MKQQSKQFIAETKAMLAAEMQKVDKQIDFLSLFQNATNIQDVRKVCKNNQIGCHYKKKFNSVDIYNGGYYTFYGNDTIEENLQNLSDFPLKYKKELSYLLENDENIQTAINDFITLKNIEHTANISKNGFESWSGCRVSKYVRKTSEEIHNKYYWKLESMVSPILKQTERIIIPEFEKVFIEVYKLQDDMWGGENRFNEERKRAAFECNEPIIQKLLDSLNLTQALNKYRIQERIDFWENDCKKFLKTWGSYSKMDNLAKELYTDANRELNYAKSELFAIS